MRTIGTIFASVSLTILFVGYAPMTFWDLFAHSSNNFGGTSITTIQGTDTLSASRTTINNNFSSLNTNKVEIEALAATTSLTQLAKVGTITQGIWNGTAITAAYGGTGSTTLSLNQVLLGNATGILKTVAGFGLSGQSLVSNGVGVAPTWQSISFDLTGNYTNTGQWAFNGASTTNFAISNYLKWNNQIYTINGAAAASSTSLCSNASNALFWCAPQIAVVSSITSSAETTNTSTTTLATLAVPSNSLGSGRSLRISANFQSKTDVCYFEIEMGNGSATSTIGWMRSTAASFHMMDSQVVSTSTSGSLATSQGVATGPLGVANLLTITPASPTWWFFTNYVPYVTTSPLYVDFSAAKQVGTSATCGLLSARVERLNQ